MGIKSAVFLVICQARKDVHVILKTYRDQIFDYNRVFLDPTVEEKVTTIVCVFLRKAPTRNDVRRLGT